MVPRWLQFVSLLCILLFSLYDNNHLKVMSGLVEEDEDNEEWEALQEILELQRAEEYGDILLLNEDMENRKVAEKLDLESDLGPSVLDSLRRTDRRKLNDPIRSSFGSMLDKVRSQEGSSQQSASTRSSGSSQQKIDKASFRMKDEIVNKMLNTDSILHEIGAGSAKRHATQQGHVADIARMRVPRKYARPVEIFMRACERGLESDWRSMLGFSRWEPLNDAKLKLSFRTYSLVVHPDKNPHPDAKLAFDCLQEAYASLSHINRKRHSKDTKISAVSVRPLVELSNSVSRIVATLETNRRLLNLWGDSMKARLLLFRHRIRQGQWRSEFDEIVVKPVREFRRNVWKTLTRLRYAPSSWDRVLIIGEMVVDHKMYFICAIFGFVFTFVK